MIFLVICFPLPSCLARSLSLVTTYTTCTTCTTCTTRQAFKPDVCLACREPEACASKRTACAAAAAPPAPPASPPSPPPSSASASLPHTAPQKTPKASSAGGPGAQGTGRGAGAGRRKGHGEGEGGYRSVKIVYKGEMRRYSIGKGRVGEGEDEDGGEGGLMLLIRQVCEW